MGTSADRSGAPEGARVPIVGVFEGGGIKGIALAGAAAAALDAGYRFDSAVGTSAGALVGSLVVAGYGADELREEVCRLPWPKLLDRVPVARVPLVGKHLALIGWKGINRGDAIERTWERLLARKGVRTFEDLPAGSLEIVATDLTHTRGVVLPDDLPDYGIDPRRFSVARAVRMSSSVPFFFRPVPLRNPVTGEVSWIADGAMASKYPVQIADFRRGIPVVGFRLVADVDEHDHLAIRGPLSLAAAVISAGIGARESLPILCGQLARVVAIPAARDPLDFAIGADEARAMFEEGYEAGKAFFSTVEIEA